MTLKQQAQELRQTMLKLNGYERQMRDFLLLCATKSVIAQHGKAVAEVAGWAESGTFEYDRQRYPFRVSVFQQAVKALWESPAFVMEGVSETQRPLRYLKKIMIGVLAKEAQQQQKAGVQTAGMAEDQAGSPGVRVGSPGVQTAGTGEDQAGSPGVQVQKGFVVRCQAMLVEVQAMKVAAPEVERRLHEAMLLGHGAPEFFQQLDRLLMEAVMPQLGVVYFEAYQDVQTELAKYKADWPPQTWEETVRANFRRKLNQAYGVPVW